MRDRDEQILKETGKYGLTLRCVLDEHFTDGGTADHILNRLVREKRLASESGLPGGMCYYHLTITQARAMGVPEHRARPKKGSALRQAIQVLWFCRMAGKRRNRMERSQVAKAFGNGKGCGKPHCAALEGDEALVYRVYTPGPNSHDDYLLKVLRTDYEAAKQLPLLYEWIQAERFRFVVLVETVERRGKLVLDIAAQRIRELQIDVEVVPGLSNLAALIRERGRKHA